ncbi:MAG: oligoendopeptidase F [Candidatus Hydrogenedentes bacterium]|nr:oligoendopeptidase F [Candidatus Hydrogenedentota bacterium]
MARAKKTPPRSAMRVEDTWDLAPLFKSDAAWDRAYKRLEKQIGRLAAFRGKLGRSAKTLRDCCAFEVEFDKLAERLGSYAFLKAAEDVGNSTYQGMVARYQHLATKAHEAASYMAPEIQAIPKKRMAAFLKAPVLKEFRFSLEKLLRYRPHILSEPEERVLAMQGEVAGTAGKVFGQLNDADLRFGSVKDEKGRTIELTQSSFRSLLESPKQAVRKTAFTQFYAGYAAHANTVAATLSSSVLQDVYQARVRNYPSALEAALFHDRVPVSVYDSLIEAVHDHLDTAYRYFEIRRRALRLKTLHFYDTYVPIVPMARTRTPYDKAVGLVCEALAPLGGAYCDTLEKGLRGRWVDRYENLGKRSGAFSAGGYAGPPYILLNYKDDVIDGVFTLAHEAGHSMHTYHSARNQPFQYYDYTIFVAEVASTFNEQLLNKYLLERAPSRQMRAFLINKEIDEIRGTLVRQTMFAEFEQIIHAIAEAGEPLTLERFRAEYRALLERYFGPKVVIDDVLALEGLRIPHFYHAFYVYKYATGIAAAIALSERVLKGGKRERDSYLRFLKSGGSKYPLDLLREAGVDMERPEPVAAAMARFTRLVDELDDLV